MATVGFLEKSPTGVKKRVLENGITVFLEELPEHKKVVFLVGVGVGSKDETFNLKGISNLTAYGISHFAEHIQFTSNRFRTADEIIEDIEDGGARIHAGVDFDSTIFYILGYPRFLSKNIRIFYEAIANIEYNQEEFDREKQEVLTEIRDDLDSPKEYYLANLFFPAILRKTHSEKPILGTLKTVKNIASSDVIDFKRKFYLPSNMVIFVCGRFEEDKVLRVIERTLGRIKSAEFRQEERQISLVNRRREIFKKRKGLKLAYLALGYKVSGFNHRDSLNLMLLESILSGGMASRLAKKLRRQRGIAYDDVERIYDDYGGIGVFHITVGGFDPCRFKEAKGTVLKELEDLKTNLVSKREFMRAKNLLLADDDDDLENLKWRAELLSDAYFKRRIFDPRNCKKDISKISRESIRRVAQKYFSDKYTLTALVPENFEK